MPRLLSLLLAAFVAAPAFAQYGESIEVARVVFDVRVTTRGGEPVPDLTADDFTVELSGAPATVVSASWVEEGAIAHAKPAKVRIERGPDGERVLRATAEPDEPRLIVLFIQTDFARETVRLNGQMKFRSYAEELVRSFLPADRVAVFSFDSHLKFRSDLTADKEAAIQALRDSVLINTPPAPAAVGEPSLAMRLDAAEMRRATSSERGLQLVATALKDIPGAKTLLLLGWGLGSYGDGLVRMRHDWKDAFRGRMRR